MRLVCEGDWAPYRSWALHTLWSDLQRHGHKVVCVLNGLIGKGVQDVLIIVGYDDFAARQAAQPLFMGQSERVLDEEIHLLESSPYTEGRGVNVEDRRNIYGVRRWWIDPKDWDEFVGLSYEGIWPAMDYVRARHSSCNSSNFGRLRGLFVYNRDVYDDCRWGTSSWAFFARQAPPAPGGWSVSTLRATMTPPCGKTLGTRRTMECRPSCLTLLRPRAGRGMRSC
eukprot:COSAG02_NODE_2451_length_8826_cov_26.741836_3_plen_225_part_00